MANFNKVILAGNLTRDPEMRYTPKGTAVARITLAINRNYTTETGERKEEVCFVDVDAWGKQAETISKYMKKGRPFLVEGRLKQDTWEDKNTHQKQSKLRVVLEGFSFIDSRGPEADNGEVASRPRAAAASTPAAAAPAPSAEAEAPQAEEDDVPF